MIRTIEELSMNAWPALQILHYDGWVLRCADGYTKRANSIYPLYPSEIDVGEKIDFCESFYQDRNLPVVFKLTHASTPANLDVRLKALGYCPASHTSVQLLDLTQGEYGTMEDIELSSEDSETWQAAIVRMNGMDSNHKVTHENILRAILPGKCFASLSVEGRVTGCGLAVLQAGYLGLFDIVIDTPIRARGYGTRLVNAMLAWGVQQGAHTAYLQVMCDNEPATRLYRKLGFMEKYRYWYRIKT